MFILCYSNPAFTYIQYTSILLYWVNLLVNILKMFIFSLLYAGHSSLLCKFKIYNDMIPVFVCFGQGNTWLIICCGHFSLLREGNTPLKVCTHIIQQHVTKFSFMNSVPRILVFLRAGAACILKRIMILKCIFKNLDGGAWTGFIWPRTGALVNAIMNLPFSEKNVWNFLTGWRSVSFLRRNLLHGVSYQCQILPCQRWVQ
jgi:hypothetical protein